MTTIPSRFELLDNDFVEEISRQTPEGETPTMSCLEHNTNRLIDTFMKWVASPRDYTRPGYHVRQAMEARGWQDHNNLAIIADCVAKHTSLTQAAQTLFVDGTGLEKPANQRTRRGP